MTTSTFCEHELVLVLETASALMRIVIVLRRSFFAGKTTLVPTKMICIVSCHLATTKCLYILIDTSMVNFLTRLQHGPLSWVTLEILLGEFALDEKITTHVGCMSSSHFQSSVHFPTGEPERLR